jgi:Cu/Zn superoxide dismutase
MNVSRSLAALAAGILFLAASPALADTSTLTIPIATLNASGESGTAVLTQTPDGVQVVVTIKGAPADAQPMHIHAGTCAKINAAPEWPLTSVTAGKSTSLVKGVTIDQMLKTPYAINVHKSTADLADYVACGNIVAGK